MSLHTPQPADSPLKVNTDKPEALNWSSLETLEVSRRFYQEAAGGDEQLLFDPKGWLQWVEMENNAPEKCSRVANGLRCYRENLQSGSPRHPDSFKTVQVIISRIIQYGMYTHPSIFSNQQEIDQNFSDAFYECCLTDIQSVLNALKPYKPFRVTFSLPRLERSFWFSPFLQQRMHEAFLTSPATANRFFHLDRKGFLLWARQMEMDEIFTLPPRLAYIALSAQRNWSISEQASEIAETLEQCMDNLANHSDPKPIGLKGVFAFLRDHISEHELSPVLLDQVCEKLVFRVFDSPTSLNEGGISVIVDALKDWPEYQRRIDSATKKRGDAHHAAQKKLLKYGSNAIEAKKGVSHNTLRRQLARGNFYSRSEQKKILAILRAEREEISADRIKIVIQGVEEFARGDSHTPSKVQLSQAESFFMYAITPCVFIDSLGKEVGQAKSLFSFLREPPSTLSTAGLERRWGPVVTALGRNLDESEIIETFSDALSASPHKTFSSLALCEVLLSKRKDPREQEQWLLGTLSIVAPDFLKDKIKEVANLPELENLGPCLCNDGRERLMTFLLFKLGSATSLGINLLQHPSKEFRAQALSKDEIYTLAYAQFQRRLGDKVREPRAQAGDTNLLAADSYLSPGLWRFRGSWKGLTPASQTAVQDLEDVFNSLVRSKQFPIESRTVRELLELKGVGLEDLKSLHKRLPLCSWRIRRISRLIIEAVRTNLSPAQLLLRLPKRAIRWEQSSDSSVGQVLAQIQRERDVETKEALDFDRVRGPVLPDDDDPITPAAQRATRIGVLEYIRNKRKIIFLILTTGALWSARQSDLRRAKKENFQALNFNRLSSVGEDFSDPVDLFQLSRPLEGQDRYLINSLHENWDWEHDEILGKAYHLLPCSLERFLHVVLGRAQQSDRGKELTIQLLNESSSIPVMIGGTLGLSFFQDNKFQLVPINLHDTSIPVPLIPPRHPRVLDTTISIPDMRKFILSEEYKYRALEESPAQIFEGPDSHFVRTLFEPALSAETFGQLAPELADAVNFAKDRPWHEAVEILRVTATNFLKYDGKTRYDQFDDAEFQTYFEAICYKRKGDCTEFALVYHECLNQAGIGSVLVSCFYANKQTVTNKDAHATNLLLGRGLDGEIVPFISDATGSSSEEAPTGGSDNTPLQPLMIIVATVGGWLAWKKSRSSLHLDMISQEDLDEALRIKLGIGRTKSAGRDDPLSDEPIKLDLDAESICYSNQENLSGFLLKVTEESYGRFLVQQEQITESDLNSSPSPDDELYSLNDFATWYDLHQKRKVLSRKIIEQLSGEQHPAPVLAESVAIWLDRIASDKYYLQWIRTLEKRHHEGLINSAEKQEMQSLAVIYREKPDSLSKFLEASKQQIGIEVLSNVLAETDL